MSTRITSFCLPADGRCRLQGRRRRQGHELHVQRRQGGHAGATEVRAGDIASSRIPWGTKHYFSRDQFDADLKRIVAFYKDRGYPDARITSTDVKLNKDQTSVKLAINIDEGEPVRVERVVFTGFDAVAGTASEGARIEAAAARPVSRSIAR